MGRKIINFFESIVTEVVGKPKSQPKPQPKPQPAKAQPKPQPAKAQPKPPPPTPPPPPPTPPPPPPVFKDSSGAEHSTAAIRDQAQAQIDRKKKFSGGQQAGTASGVKATRVTKAAGRPGFRVSKLGSIGTSSSTGGSGVAIS